MRRQGALSTVTQRRVQRTKTEPLPDGCVYVGRPTKWGNPFRVERRDGKWCVVDEDDGRGGRHGADAIRWLLIPWSII